MPHLSQSSDEISKAVNIFFENKNGIIGDQMQQHINLINHDKNINFIFYQPTT